ncbi:MAG TPA: sigma-70 family RNA polymerase sigma factor [Anaerolineales bacterium]|nr:sigma-70 family RNA polymerase sigma factor [Anaerolineales bacterium]
MQNDLTLLNAARKMDKDALVKIFDLYASPLYNFALRLCGDPSTADHIVGDVFTRLLDQLSAGKGPTSNLRSYLYESAYHRFVDETRAARRTAPLEALTSLRQDVRAGALHMEDWVLFESVLDAIQRDLTADQRHVILLRFLEGCSLLETAAILGKEINHIKVIQTRAIAKLRQVFEAREVRAAMALPRIEERSPALRI